MKNLSRLSILITIILVFSLFLTPNLIAAEKSLSTETASVKNRLAQKEINQKNNASKEIDRRFAALDKLTLRISEMKKLSDADKNLLINQAKDQIAALQALRVKIDSDTDPATLKADRQAIASQYRIYMLFIPRIQVLASADRIIEICNDISSFVAKIQDRLAKNPAKNTNTTIQQALENIQNKLSDAKTEAQAAQTLVNQLLPDNGDTNLVKSNQKALQEARAKLVLAKKDIADIQKDIQTIRKSLSLIEKAKASSASATSSAIER